MFNTNGFLEKILYYNTDNVSSEKYYILHNWFNNKKKNENIQYFEKTPHSEPHLMKSRKDKTVFDDENRYLLWDKIHHVVKEAF